MINNQKEEAIRILRELTQNRNRPTIEHQPNINNMVNEQYVPVRGRPRIYTENELKQKRAEYHKSWYERNKAQHAQMLRDLHKRLIVYMYAANPDEYDDGRYVLNTLHDYREFIGKLLEFMKTKNIIRDYELKN